MLTGISLTCGEAPTQWIEQHQLQGRIVDRGGEPELHFLFRTSPAVLPVWHEGSLLLARWGCGRSDSRILPATGWTRRETVESGWWDDVGGVEVEIPATAGYDAEVWFLIRIGVRGILVADEHGIRRIYVMVEPSSHYYRVMTRSEWMPCLVEQHI